MATAKFFLKDPKSNSDTLIFLIFQFSHIVLKDGIPKYKFLKYSTGEKVHPNLWNPKTQRVKNVERFPEFFELNHRLDMIESIARDTYRKLLNDDLIPTPEMMRDKLNERLNRKPRVVPETSLINFTRKFIEKTVSGGRLTENGKKMSIHTIKGYKTTLNHLIEFEKIYPKNLNFDAIDQNFYDAFLGWMNKDNYSTNTIGKNIKNIKVIMNAALEDDLTKNTAHQSKRFKTIEELTDSIYLSDRELQQIYELDLSHDANLEISRDVFIFSCNTGLRWSDYDKIRRENIIQNPRGKFLHFRPQKVPEPVMIPLNWVAMEIMGKYGFRLPKPFTNQFFNRQLKEIGKLAGIMENVTYSKTLGGKRVDKVCPKYEMITTHTARRSFATNMFLADVPAISIMKLTGHHTEKAFMRYIRITQEDNALKLINHPYFSQQKPATL